jgi:hypothetical protein
MKVKGLITDIELDGEGIGVVIKATDTWRTAIV